MNCDYFQDGKKQRARKNKEAEGGFRQSGFG